MRERDPSLLRVLCKRFKCSQIRPVVLGVHLGLDVDQLGRELEIGFGRDDWCSARSAYGNEKELSKVDVSREQVDLDVKESCSVYWSRILGKTSD